MRRATGFLIASASMLFFIISLAPQASAVARHSFMWRSTDSGTTWTQPSVANNSGFWVSLAGSSDGTKIIAGQFNQSDAENSFVYRSVDSGATWNKIADLPSGMWFGLASSADGSILAAANGNNGFVYLSTDSGTSWNTVPSLGQSSWYSLAMSADGTKILAGQGLPDIGFDTGRVYISDDSGENWSEQTDLGLGNWWTASMAADGETAVAINFNTNVMHKYSADEEVVWEQSGSEEMSGLYSVKMSGDGQTIIAAEGGSGSDDVWLSTDGGNSWSELPAMSEEIFTVTVAGLSTSYDGEIMTVGGYGYMYTTSDHGENWTPILPLGNVLDGFWYSSFMSYDGTNRFISKYGTNSEDSDGINHLVEEAAPNNGDANNDGEQDSGQDHVVSFINPVTEEYATLSVNEECTIDSVSINAESENEVQDNSYVYHFGFMNFWINCSTAGFEATVSQYYYNYTQAPEELSLRKYNNATDQYATIAGATISAETIGEEPVIVVSYQIIDGGPLDEDANENGLIRDPAGLGLYNGNEDSPGSNEVFSSSDSSEAKLAETGQSKSAIALIATLLILSPAVFTIQRIRNSSEL